MVHGRSDALLLASDSSHLVDCVGRQSNAACKLHVVDSRWSRQHVSRFQFSLQHVI
jgi:hypothetical protein